MRRSIPGVHYLPRSSAQTVPGTGGDPDARWKLTEEQRTALAVAVIVTAWCWSVVPRVIQTLAAGKSRGSVGEVAGAGSRIAELSLLGLTAILLVLCLLVVPLSLRETRARPLTGVVLFAAPWSYLVLRGLFVGDPPTREALAYPFVVLALWTLAPGVRVLRHLGALCAAALTFSVVLGLVWPARGLFFYSSGDLVLEDKATLSVGILVGFLTHGNNLGVFAALSLPLIALIRTRWLRYSMLAVGALALFWTASRSSFAAAVITVLVVLLIALLPRAWYRVAGSVIALAPWGVVVALPVLTDDPASFTNRGFIWAQSLAYWQTSPLTGLGPGWYGSIGSTSDRIATTAFHGHNQFVQLLTTGGVLAAVMVGALLLFCAVRAGRMLDRGHRIAVVYLATLAGVCLLERAMSIVDNFNMFPVAFLPLAVLVFAPEGARQAPAVQPGVSAEPEATPTGLSPSASGRTR